MRKLATYLASYLCTVIADALIILGALLLAPPLGVLLVSLLVREVGKGIARWGAGALPTSAPLLSEKESRGKGRFPS